MMKKTMVITAAALRSLSAGIGLCRPAGWTALTRIRRRATRARRFAISHPTRNLCRRSRGRRTAAPFLHEAFRFLAGPSHHLEGSLIEGVSGLRLPGDSLFHCLEGHRGRLPGKHVDLIHRGHDVRLVEALFLRDLRELLRCGDAHLVRDRPCTHVQRASKNPWEPQAVVHLIREIGPARGDDTGSGLRGFPWPDLRHRIRDHEEDRIVRHRGDPILLNHAGSRLRCGDRDVRVSHRLRDATLPIASIRLEGELPFLRIVVRRHLDILSMTTDDPPRVDEDDVLRPRTGRDEELRGSDVRRAGTDQRDCDVRHLLADDLQGVDEAGDVDRRGPLLVIVPYRDLALLPQTLEDAETFRLRNVLEVHATERGRDELDRLDDLLRVFRRDVDRESVDTAEVLELQGLAVHHRQSGLRPDVPEAEDACAVRDDGDLIPLVRQGPNLARVSRDVEAGLRDPGRVPDREVVEAPDRHAGDDLDLALIVRVVLCGLFLREVRTLQVLLDFLWRRRLHLLATRALLRGHHRSTRKELGDETGWLP